VPVIPVGRNLKAGNTVNSTTNHYLYSSSSSTELQVMGQLKEKQCTSRYASSLSGGVAAVLESLQELQARPHHPCPCWRTLKAQHNRQLTRRLPHSGQSDDLLAAKQPATERKATRATQTRAEACPTRIRQRLVERERITRGQASSAHLQPLCLARAHTVLVSAGATLPNC